MASLTSYNNDKVVTVETEYPATDPASGAFFQPDYKKNEDLKIMLDGSKDSLKLEAMKRIIGMIAKGRDASDLFPAVVKNVVSKNIEVKKLVYVYLVRYAEEQQDLALLSISTFQRALKDPNQLIRASALRVLSSIRVSMIVPIVMLAIRDSASDMSPYVRKTAAHAIPKLYRLSMEEWNSLPADVFPENYNLNLFKARVNRHFPGKHTPPKATSSHTINIDPEQKEELVSIIDKLLSDKAPLVIGSAAMAFTEVCPDRMSLIHRSYRKLCSLLADVDEWGQLALLNVLTVYARTCFPDPNNESYSSDSETEKPFYESESSDTSPRRHAPSATVAADLRLLLRAAKPLLQSRNSAVVMATAQLFVHTAPIQELPPVAKAMVRLLRAPVEVQSVVLNSIAALTVNKRALFEPFLKSFFVRNSDPSHVKLLKLEILTNLATEATAPVVLREFQTYVTSSDKECCVATIQAIGRLAVRIQSETETCLSGLLHLLSSKDEVVVCEAVVVVKRVVCGACTGARAALARAARLLRADRLAPTARAAALWLVSEHGARSPRAADILAHMATNFADQDELVKLQVLTLAVKLSITQPDTLPISRYILSVSKYDVNYDVRDRARFLKAIMEPKEGSLLHQYKEKIFCQMKQNQTNHSNSQDREQYTLGSLSQYVGGKAAGYCPLPTAPSAVLDHTLRDVDSLKLDTAVTSPAKSQKDKDFYYEPASSGSGESGSNSSTSSSESEEEASDEEDNDSKPKIEKEDKTNNHYSEGSSSSGTSDSESDSEDSDSSSNEQNGEATVNNKAKTKQEVKIPAKPDKSNLELLLELDEVAGSLPTLTPTAGGMLSPPTTAPQGVGEADSISYTSAAWTPSTSALLFPRVVCNGLEANYRWTRSPHLFSNKMSAIEINFTNHSNNDVNNVRLHKKTLTGSRSVHDFSPIQVISPTFTAIAVMGVDFADTIQPIEFTIMSTLGEVPVSITAPVGELMRAVTMSESRFELELKKLRGMTECDKKAAKMVDDQQICRCVYETANVGAITTSGSILRFAGRMTSSQDLVLLSVKMEEDSCRVTANCSNMAVASMLANQVAQAFAKS